MVATWHSRKILSKKNMSVASLLRWLVAGHFECEHLRTGQQSLKCITSKPGLTKNIVQAKGFCSFQLTALRISEAEPCGAKNTGKSSSYWFSSSCRTLLSPARYRQGCVHLSWLHRDLTPLRLSQKEAGGKTLSLWFISEWYSCNSIQAHMCRHHTHKPPHPCLKTEC